MTPLEDHQEDTMAHKVYSEKTGDPTHDNNARRANRKLARLAEDLHFVGYRNRKRKKFLKRVEGGHYMDLIASVASSMTTRS